jgi:uncharacterized protein YjbI with pentapeptide repeats
MPERQWFPSPARLEFVLDDGGLSLTADCERCFGLCCVAPGFAASADFAIDKPPGRPCPNLQPSFRCGIHEDLRGRGFRGCTAYDCFGAGQRVSQLTFGGMDWREAPDTAAQMFAVFAIARQLHELLWYVSQALASQRTLPLQAELADAFAATERLTRGSAQDLLALDLPAHRDEVNALLVRSSELMRAGQASTAGQAVSYAGADLVAARLNGASLSGASMRGACLIGAELRGADLRAADFTGADLRDADLSGADLTEGIFLTQAQLETAKGDASTKLPLSLTRPAHWPPRPR